MEKCHLAINFNPKIEKSKLDIKYSIKFCEDTTIAKPQFIKNSSVEHTIQARWITPCRIAVKSNDENSKTEMYCCNAYYHPLAYQLARNEEFKRIIIENAIENFCAKKKLVTEYDYNIVSTSGDDIIENNIFSQPQYELSLFSSNFSHQKFIQLFIWLPFIISSNSIIIETSRYKFYLQIEKPHKYEMNLVWPDEVKDFQICFCNFLKKEKRLVLVGEYFGISNDNESKLDDLCDKENKSPLISNRKKSSLQICDTSSDSNISTNTSDINAMCDIYHCNSNDSQVECFNDSNLHAVEAEVCVSQNEHFVKGMISGAVKSKKNRKVRFNSFNSCLIFEDIIPTSEILERSGHNVPMKTNDGCSAKKFNYHLNKSPKNNRDKGNKSSARSKRNNNKKKK